MSVYHLVTLCKEVSVSTRKLMNTKQAAEYVGTYFDRAPSSPRTIVSWIHAGFLRATREPGARGRFVIDEVDLLETLGATREQIEQVSGLQKILACLSEEDQKKLLESNLPVPALLEVPAELASSL